MYNGIRNLGFVIKQLLVVLEVRKICRTDLAHLEKYCLIGIWAKNKPVFECQFFQRGWMFNPRFFLWKSVLPTRTLLWMSVLPTRTLLWVSVLPPWLEVKSFPWPFRAPCYVLFTGIFQQRGVFFQHPTSTPILASSSRILSLPKNYEGHDFTFTPLDSFIYTHVNPPPRPFCFKYIHGTFR